MSSHALSGDRTSIIRFARDHTFVTIFGVVLPLSVFAVFVGYPIVYTVYLSFFEWNGMAPEKTFVGLANYQYLITDSYFYTALLNNIKWIAVTLIFPVTLGLCIAYGLRAKILPFPTLIRTVIFFPVTMSLISVGLIVASVRKFQKISLV